MDDKVILQIDGRRISGLLAYDIEADLYQVADRFTLQISDPDAPVKKGMRCQLYVNDQLELTGIIDATDRTWGKGGRTLNVEGRDLMGLLFDSHIKEAFTLKGKSAKQLAERLLKTVPYISRSHIVYQNGAAGKRDLPQQLSQVEPGMTVGEVLSLYAASRGLLFFALPDGTFTFGRPKSKGLPQFKALHLHSGAGNNVTTGRELDDISGRYSTVTVISQLQGQDSDGMDTGKLTARYTVTDPDFPFHKPFVTLAHNDGQTPKELAGLIMDKQRADGYALSYTFPGHSQNGRNFAINELVQVKDEDLEVEGTFLCYNRRFRRSKEEGTLTELRLGLPGMVGL